MGHLPVLAVILLQPAIVWTQATAPGSTGVATNPLLSLNVPNLGNLLGGLLGGLGMGGSMGNFGGGFGNMGGFGFSSMLGLFNHHNNLLFNQFLLNGFFGIAFMKFVALVLVLGGFLVGGLLIKFLGIAAILSLVKWTPHYSHYHRRSSGFRSQPQILDESWPHIHPSDNSFMWEERRARNFHSH